MRILVVIVVLMLVLSGGVARGAMVTGALKLAPGMPGDLANTLVMLYASYDDWNSFRPLTMVASSGSGSTVVYTINNIPAGVYYLDAWKDNDANGVWSEGDYLGVYGIFAWPVVTPQPLFVVEGQTTVANVAMYLPGAPVPVQRESWGRIKAAYR